VCNGPFLFCHCSLSIPIHHFIATNCSIGVSRICQLEQAFQFHLGGARNNAPNGATKLPLFTSFSCANAKPNFDCSDALFVKLTCSCSICSDRNKTGNQFVSLDMATFARVEVIDVVKISQLSDKRAIIKSLVAQGSVVSN